MYIRSMLDLPISEKQRTRVIIWNLLGLHDVQFKLKTHKKSCPNQVLISHFLPYRLVRHHLWTNNPLCKSKKPFWITRNSRFVVKTFAWACLKVQKSQDSARFGQPLLLGVQFGCVEEARSSGACILLHSWPLGPSKNHDFLKQFMFVNFSLHSYLAWWPRVLRRLW